MTLRSAEARIVNTWIIDKVFENGVNKTTEFKDLFKDWKLIIKSDKNYELSYTFFSKVTETGTWEFQEGATKINLRKDGTGTNVWLITRLKKNDAWVEQKQNNGDLVQYRMK